MPTTFVPESRRRRATLRSVRPKAVTRRLNDVRPEAATRSGGGAMPGSTKWASAGNSRILRWNRTVSDFCRVGWNGRALHEIRLAGCAARSTDLS